MDTNILPSVGNFARAERTQFIEGEERNNILSILRSIAEVQSHFTNMPAEPADPRRAFKVFEK